MPLTNNLDAFDEEVVGRDVGNMYGETRLQLVQLLLNLQNHERQFVGGAASFAVYTTYINISEVVIGATLEGRHTHLRRSRLVVELNPEARQQFLGIVARKGSIVDALLVEREQVLVDVTGIHGVPAIEFSNGAEVYEPIHLNGFPQVARSVGGHPTADVGNLLQLLLALCVLFFCSHLLSQFCMALGKKDGGIARDGHCLQLLLFVGGLGVVDEVEAREFLLDALLHIEQTLAIHLTIHGRMTGGALFHELREHTSMIGILPLFRDVVENALALCLPFPIRDDLALIGVNILL